MILAKINFVLQERVQIRVNELDYEANVHQIVMFRGLPCLVLSRATFALLWADNLDQLWHKGALVLLIPLQFVCNFVKASQNLNLSEQLDDLILSLRLLLHHLERNFAAGSLALALSNAAVATLSDYRFQLILLYNAIPHHFIHAKFITIIGVTRLA